jgi:hypothetical protein
MLRVAALVTVPIRGETSAPILELTVPAIPIRAETSAPIPELTVPAIPIRGETSAPIPELTVPAIPILGETSVPIPELTVPAISQTNGRENKNASAPYKALKGTTPIVSDLVLWVLGAYDEGAIYRTFVKSRLKIAKFVRPAGALVR